MQFADGPTKVQAFPRFQNRSEWISFSDRSMDETEWTLIILAPMRKSRKWYSARGQVGWSWSGSHAKATRAFLVYDIRIRSLLVSTLDAINSAVELALQSWQQVYDELQDHLPPREYYDTLLSNDDSLPASIDCFWVIDRLGDIMPQLIHTKEEWDEWLRYHLSNDVKQSKDWGIKGPLGEIEAHMQMISGLYDDFNALEKRAETIISAVSLWPPNSFHHIMAHPSDLQPDECERDEGIAFTRRKCQVIDICHNFLPSAIILHCEYLPALKRRTFNRRTC